MECLVGDFSIFTQYPGKLAAKFKRYSCKWTYMSKCERKQKEFQRPKRWFTRKEYKLTNECKVFSLTTSNGFSTSFVCPKPYDHLQFAAKIKTQLGPFLKKCFPNKRTIRIILDSEHIQHAPPCKAAWKKFKVTCLPNWPTPYVISKHVLSKLF